MERIVEFYLKKAGKENPGDLERLKKTLGEKVYVGVCGEGFYSISAQLNEEEFPKTAFDIVEKVVKKIPEKQGIIGRTIDRIRERKSYSRGYFKPRSAGFTVYNPNPVRMEAL